VHPPVQLEPFLLLLRLEEREPASLTDSLRQQLLNELLEQELSSAVEAQVQAQLQRLDLTADG